MLRFFNNGARGAFYATNCYTTNSPVEIEIDCEKAKRGYTMKSYMLNRMVTVTVQMKTVERRHTNPTGESHGLIQRFYNGILNEDLGVLYL